MERRFTGAGRTRPSWQFTLGFRVVTDAVTTNPTCTVLPARSSAIASTKNSVAEVISCTERQQCEWTMRYASGSNSTSRSLAATSNRIIFQQAMEAHSSARRYSFVFWVGYKATLNDRTIAVDLPCTDDRFRCQLVIWPECPRNRIHPTVGMVFACSRAKSSICMVGSGIPVPYGHPADNTAKFIQHSSRLILPRTNVRSGPEANNEESGHAANLSGLKRTIWRPLLEHLQQILVFMPPSHVERKQKLTPPCIAAF